MPRRPGSVDLPGACPPPIALARELPRALRTNDPDAGGWRRLRRGAYATLDGADAWQARLGELLARIAAVHRLLPGDHVFSHESAALLWGLPVTPGGSRVHLIRRIPASSRAARDVVHHVQRLEPGDVVERQGLPVTTLERTVLDCASADPRSGLVVADAALRRGLDRSAARARLERMVGYRGVRRARAVVAFADDGAESAGESMARHLVLAAGLPVPRTQVELATADGTFWADLGWEAWRVLAEYDGAAKYTAQTSAADAVLRERRREVLVEREGWRVFRITAADLSSPERTVDDLLRLAPAAARRTLTPRPDLIRVQPRRLRAPR